MEGEYSTTEKLYSETNIVKMLKKELNIMYDSEHHCEFLCKASKHLKQANYYE